MDPTSSSPDQPLFEELCAQVGDFETLPTVPANPSDEDTYEEESAPLDGLILAGLVTPY